MIPQYLVTPNTPRHNRRCFPELDRNLKAEQGGSLKYQPCSQNVLMVESLHKAADPGTRFAPKSSCEKPCTRGEVLLTQDGFCDLGHLQNVLAETWNRHSCCKSSPTKGDRRGKGNQYLRYGAGEGKATAISINRRTQ